MQQSGAGVLLAAYYQVTAFRPLQAGHRAVDQTPLVHGAMAGREGAVVLAAVVEHAALPRHAEVVAEAAGDLSPVRGEALVRDHVGVEALPRLLQSFGVVEDLGADGVVVGIRTAVGQGRDDSARVAQQEDVARVGPTSVQSGPDEGVGSESCRR